MTATAVPRYQQLKDLIIRRISTGELCPNDRVPSEHELVDSAGVSRMTANRALRELTDEGYVERIAGKGTFVADLKAASHVLEVRNIAEEVEHRGHTHSASVLACERTAADARIASALRTADGAEVLHVKLVHFESGVPIQLEDRYIVPGFAPDLLEQDFTRTTPSAYLSSIAPLQEAEHVVRAETADESVRQSLDMIDGEACLVVSRRTWAKGKPATYARLYHPGSRFELSGHYVPPGTQATRPAAVDGEPK
jgi:GntR family histidine utilization transcriptional repressor